MSEKILYMHRGISPIILEKINIDIFPGGGEKFHWHVENIFFVFTLNFVHKIRLKFYFIAMKKNLKMYNSYP